MTLIELVIAIAIISIGVAGVMTAFTTVVRNSADPMIQKQMLATAEEMMEEITLKPYTPTISPPAGCNVRKTFIGVSDYNGYACSGIYDVDGNAIASIAGYSVNVAVVIDNATFGSNVSTSNAKQITVTVTHGSQSISLVGWRTNYAS